MRYCKNASAEPAAMARSQISIELNYAQARGIAGGREPIATENGGFRQSQQKVCVSIAEGAAAPCFSQCAIVVAGLNTPAA
jgi:hypothetical protein